jgi:hypothetical protein
MAVAEARDEAPAPLPPPNSPEVAWFDLLPRIPPREALGHRALHLGEADLQHHLLLAAHHHQVRNPVGRVALGEVQRAVELLDRGDRTRQDDAVVRGAHLDPFVWQDLLEPLLELGDVGRDLDLDVRDQPPVGPRSVSVVRPGALPST